MRFKSVLLMCLAGLALLGIGGCGGEKKADAPAPVKAQAAEVPQAEQPAGKSKVLVVYFSHSGNTETVAKMFQQETGADMFRVVAAKPYSQDYNTVTKDAKKEKENNERPALRVAKVENLGNYDTVFLGFPNWWSTMPMPMFTFLEANDMSGKTIIPFVTHEGSAFGTSMGDLKKLAPNAKILDGFEVRGGRAAGANANVAKFVAGLGLKK